MLKKLKRTRPSQTAFNAVRAERDAANDALKALTARIAEHAAARLALKSGLDNLYSRLTDLEGGIQGLRVLAAYQCEHASEDRQEMAHVEHAQDWILRHLLAEVADAAETADDAKLGKSTTDRGPVPTVKGGAT
jgi:hypothetical protein